MEHMILRVSLGVMFIFVKVLYNIFLRHNKWSISVYRMNKYAD